MGIKNDNCDVGAEADTFREAFNQYECVATHDKHNDDDNSTTIEYINGEGDPPFIKYRLRLEAVSTHTPEEYAEAKAEAEQNKEAAE